MAEWTQNQKELKWLLLGSLALGCLQDFLFFGKELGISYPLFVVAVYALFFWQARHRIDIKPSWSQRFAWFLTLPIVLLSATFSLFSNDAFHLFNFLLVPALFIMQTMLLTGRHRAKWYSLGFIGEAIETVLIHTLINVRLPFVYVRDWIKAKVDGNKYGIAMKVLIGLGISLLLLLVVLPLLARADVVFGHFLREIPRMMFDWKSIERLYRLFLIVMFSCIGFAYLWSLFGERKEIADTAAPAAGQKLVWDGIILVTVLTLVNVVYAAFTFVQISYLFSGMQAVLPDGLTYAEYARNGFNELVMVTIINFIILLSTMHLASRAQPTIYRIVQVLLSLLTVCTSFMLYSAYYRLSLYEQAYGYTHSRLAAHAFMIFLFVLFVIALLKIWRNNFSLIKYYAIAGLIAYVILNYINMDMIIAKNNIARYHETGRIDIDYLSELSYDAVPVIMELMKDKAVATPLSYRLQDKREELHEVKSWQSFNLSKARAKAWLDAQPE